jgi:hypothetical protein
MRTSTAQQLRQLSRLLLLLLHTLLRLLLQVWRCILLLLQQHGYLIHEGLPHKRVLLCSLHGAPSLLPQASNQPRYVHRCLYILHAHCAMQLQRQTMQPLQQHVYSHKRAGTAYSCAAMHYYLAASAAAAV